MRYQNLGSISTYMQMAPTSIKDKVKGTPMYLKKGLIYTARMLSRPRTELVSGMIAGVGGPILITRFGLTGNPTIDSLIVLGTAVSGTIAGIHAILYRGA